MSKIVNVKTTTETKVTTETTELVPAYFIEINPHQDFGAEEYYKSMGYEVKTMIKFGKKRIYAIIPVEGYDEATDEEKAILAAKADGFTQKMDNMRRSAARKIATVLEHENVSLDGLFDAGYDPTLDSIEVAIKISKKADDDDSEDASEDMVESEDIDTDDDAEDNGCSGKKRVNRGAYDPYTDDNNPAYIVAKEILYAKLHEMVDELEGEELEMATAIMSGISQRQFAKDHNISRSTLQRPWNELMAKCKETLKDYYI